MSKNIFKNIFLLVHPFTPILQFYNTAIGNDTWMTRNILLPPPRRRRWRWRGLPCSRGTPACSCGPRTTASSSASSTSPTSSSSTTSGAPRLSWWRTTSQSSCSHACTSCFPHSCPGLRVDILCNVVHVHPASLLTQTLMSRDSWGSVRVSVVDTRHLCIYHDLML